MVTADDTTEEKKTFYLENSDVFTHQLYLDGLLPIIFSLTNPEGYEELFNTGK